MTTQTALQQLRDATRRLVQSVTGLMVATHEDRPAGRATAAVDDFVERVDELDSSVAAVDREAAGTRRSGLLVASVTAIDAGLHDAALLYWRDLRSFAAIDEMRRATRMAGTEWRTWQQALEASLQACEQPLTDALAAIGNLWREVANEIQPRV